jgi:hypothetical protein
MMAELLLSAGTEENIKVGAQFGKDPRRAPRLESAKAVCGVERQRSRFADRA